MPKARTPKTSPATEPALVVPASKPRNRLATHPLLRKSGTHADARQRRNGQLDDRQRDSMRDVDSTKDRRGDDD
ncbi:MAG: hypothetical protein JNL19_03240 [Burkholderiales bacterium]|nr:hypothetical protein [Burkholderiales bacterium]